MKKIIIVVVFLAFVFVALYNSKNKVTPLFFEPRETEESNISPTTTVQPTSEIVTIAQNLEIPWEVAFLPNKDILVTERSGKLKKIGEETKIISEIEGVKHIGEGGLLGMALHPKFSSNNYIYLYSTTQDSVGVSNRVERYKLENDSLSDRKIVLSGIKGSSNHDGGRIAFGPDGYLYVTTGDAETPDSAQDKNSLNGKILRITDEGAVPSDNPFGNAVYSLGHRNPQGIAWDKDGNLWETEHGPSGSQTGNDEVNLIEKGNNYGWPEIRGTQTKEGMQSPIIESGRNDTWAPAGLAYKNGSLFFTGLRGEALYEAIIGEGNKLTLVTHLKRNYGRLRAVTLDTDGSLYISTSNQDGRGTPKTGDDKVLKVNF